MRAFLANREQDADLRRISSAVPISGAVTVAYEREPDFFQGLNVMGEVNQVIAVESKGRVIGMGCRSVADYFINGEIRRFSYLNGLRSEVEIAGTGLIRGFECLRQLHEDDPVAGYVTTIIEKNHRAMSVLASGGRHPALPCYVNMGAYHTYAIMLNRRGRVAVPKDLVITSGDAFDLDELLAFVNGEGARRQFRPYWTAKDFESDRLRGLTQADLLVAMRNRAIVGVVAAWDQRAFKQHRVVDYAAGFGLARPGLDLATKAMGYAGLPKPGECISTVYLAMVSVAEDDPEVLSALIDTACKKASAGNVHFLCIGFHERDPLAAVVKKRRAIRYDSRVFAVDWNDEATIRASLDGRIPYLEAATL